VRPPRSQRRALSLTRALGLRKRIGGEVGGERRSTAESPAFSATCSGSDGGSTRGWIVVVEGTRRQKDSAGHLKLRATK
jgi:hypothetical protein